MKPFSARKQKRHLRTWVCLPLLMTTVVLTSLLPMRVGAASKPPRFISGTESTVVSSQVGPKGAVLEAGKTGTPIDGISIEIPAGALTKEVTISLGYNTGKLVLPHGESSGIFFRISAGSLKEFNEPVTIHLSYDPLRHKGRVLVGYAIDEKGQLASVDSGTKDSKAGRADFITMVPLLFTWVYASVP
jgi:hypothetical protein